MLFKTRGNNHIELGKESSTYNIMIVIVHKFKQLVANAKPLQ